MSDINNETNENGTPVWCYDIYVEGKFGRNRTSKRESFKIVRHAATRLGLEGVKGLVDGKLIELRFKGQYAYKLVERLGYVKSNNGFAIYTTSLYGDQQVLIPWTKVG